MLRLTRKTDYALVALSRLAEHDALVSARLLADEIQAPRALLTAVMKQLQVAGLVHSKRGVHGGYVLAAPPDQINVLGVIEAVEGPVRLTLCCGEGEELSEDQHCNIEGSCQINWAIQGLNERLNGYLAGVTLAELLEPACASGIDSGANDPAARSRSTFSL